MAAMVVAVLIVSGSGASIASAQTTPTPIRGLSLGMTRGAMSAALPSAFRLRANLIVSDALDRVCGYATFDRRDIATELILFRCFFGADTLDWAGFAQAIDDAYYAGAFVYAEQSGVRIEYPPVSSATVRMLTGPTTSGETISVTEIIAGYQPTGNGREIFVRVTMTPAQAEPARPTFN